MARCLCYLCRLLTRLRLRGADAGVALALFSGNLLIAGRFLATGFSAQVWNNEYSYISIARFFRDQPWTWNPAWYGGMPFHYVYPPLFHLLVALTPAPSLGHSFHVVTAVVYALAPVALYWLGLQLFESRLPAAIAAVAYSLFPAPIYALSDFRGIGAGFAYAPWSFVAMAGYAAGPNMLALLEAMLAVGFAWKQKWVAASLALAAVLLTQWSAAAGAGIALVCAAVAQYRLLGVRETIEKYCFVVLSACGLAAFWITPGAVRSAWINLRALSAGEHPAAWGWKTAALIALGLAVLGLAAWRRVPPLAAFFLAWLALVGAPMVAFQVERSQVLPFTWRMSMELNVALILAGCALALAGRAEVPGHQPGRWPARPMACYPRVAVIVGALALLACSIPFLRNPWRLQPGPLAPASSAAFQASEWLRQNSPGSRVFVSGELSLALNAWTDVRQAGGGADQSPSNPVLLAAYHQLPNTCGAESAR